MLEEHITSLAMIKVNYDKGRNYIDNFVPFVAEVIKKSPHAEVAMAELQPKLYEEFGLFIPQGALNTILKRAEKQGYIQKKDKIFVKNDPVLNSLDLSQDKNKALRIIELLVSEFQNYINTNYDTEWTKEDAEIALMRYIHNHSTAILSSSLSGEEPEIFVPESSEHSDFFVGDFISHLHKNNLETFEILEIIVKGNMLANFLYYPAVGKIEFNFSRLAVYFDTGFILRALGLTNPTDKTCCIELLGLLYDLNADMRCFEHTVDEIRRVLDFALSVIKEHQESKYLSLDVVVGYVDANYSISDIELIIARLEKSIQKLRIKVVTKPRMREKYSVDENRFKILLEKRVHYKRQHALFHDLDSITAMHRLRKGQFHENLESCRALFLTTNPKLIRTSREFFKGEFSERPITIPHCISDHVLTTLAWLKKPMQFPDLPRKKILADCFAALNPPDGLWRKYLDEVDRLRVNNNIDEDDYSILRYSRESRELLMKETRGDVGVFTGGTVQEVLRKSKESIRRDIQKKLEDESKRGDLEEKKNLYTSERIREIGDFVGKTFSKVLFYFTIIIQGYIAYFSFPKSTPPIIEGWQYYLVSLAFIISTLLTFINFVSGKSLRNLCRQIEVRISDCIERLILRMLTRADS